MTKEGSAVDRDEQQTVIFMDKVTSCRRLERKRRRRFRWRTI